ncbi:MAG: parallel beta-helix domain-containing protein [Kofleriaceae bacterium]
MLRLRVLAVIIGASGGIIGCGDNLGPCDGVVGTCIPVPSDASANDAQRALLEATPGSTVAFSAGTYHFKTGLSLDVPDVRIIGAGMERTVLSFAGQTDGAQGLLVTSDGFTLEDLAVEDTRGDGVKIEGAERVVLRRTRVAWTGEPNATNGAYGLYPVQCKDVLIEDSFVRGASDAGIYVGQSENVVVRRNRAEDNVAGIEIENCIKADVYENTATSNTGGLLVFNLPGLQISNGSDTRVYRNQIFDNNTLNFAPPGNIVGVVPAGTGMVVLASHRAEVFDNDIHDHRTTNLGVISYLTLQIPISDPSYDPFPTALYFHDNRFSGVSSNPSGDLGAVILLSLAEINASGGGVPDFVWDGVVDPSRLVGGEYAAQDKLCFQRNGDGDFISLNVPPGDAQLPVTDLAPLDCAHNALPPVTLGSLGRAAR